MRGALFFCSSSTSVQLDRIEQLANRCGSAFGLRHGTPAAPEIRPHDQFVHLRRVRLTISFSASSQRRGARLVTDICPPHVGMSAVTTGTTGDLLMHLGLLKTDELLRVEWAWARGGRRRHNRVRVAGVGRPVR